MDKAYPPTREDEFTAAVERLSARLLKDCLDTYGVDDPHLPGRFFSAQAQFQRTP